jgi:hypothetical protein
MNKALSKTITWTGIVTFGLGGLYALFLFITMVVATMASDKPTPERLLAYAFPGLPPAAISLLEGEGEAWLGVDYWLAFRAGNRALPGVFKKMKPCDEISRAEIQEQLDFLQERVGTNLARRSLKIQQLECHAYRYTSKDKSMGLWFFHNPTTGAHFFREHQS